MPWQRVSTRPEKLLSANIFGHDLFPARPLVIEDSRQLSAECRPTDISKKPPSQRNSDSSLSRLNQTVGGRQEPCVWHYKHCQTREMFKTSSQHLVSHTVLFSADATVQRRWALPCLLTPQVYVYAHKPFLLYAHPKLFTTRCIDGYAC